MAVTKSLSEFKSRLAGGGARPNLFEVSIPSFPSSISDAWGPGIQDENGTFNFLCKAAQLPASTINPVTIPFRGRQLKVAGERTFADWTVTVLNDEDFQIRDGLEAWSGSINSYAGNRRSPGVGPEAYKTEALVTQFSKEGERLRSYRFHGIFPIEVSAIDLAWDADTVQEFTTTFTYDYWTVEGQAAAAGGSTSVGPTIELNLNIGL